jgi:hypothetical protein
LLRALAWLCVLLGIGSGVLGYLMARDDLLLQAGQTWPLATYQAVFFAVYAVTGLFINHDTFELLAGMLGLGVALFGFGILLGLGRARR